jgi:hypothetical protein
MKTITALQTTDGKVFTQDQRKEAERHQAKLDFITIYDNRTEQLCGRYEGSTIYGDVVADWLIENKDLVLEFLNNYK